MVKFLEWLARIFIGTLPEKVRVTDTEKSTSEPQPSIQVVGPVVRGESSYPWYMTQAVKKLLEAIRVHEAGKAGYNADFRNNNKWDLQKYTLDEVIVLSRSQVTKGEPSSAIGGYQFLTKTLVSLKSSLGLRGNERFTPEFQDDLAVALLIRRGLMAYIHDKLSAERFCNKLAMEWASLPVVTDIQGSRRYIKSGQSYYAGDGLNKAFHKPERIMALVKAIKPELEQAEKLNARTTS